MPKKELTYHGIKGISNPEKRTAYYDTKQEGLILRVTKAGTKTFAYRYKIRGKIKRYTIGKFPAISLAEARKKVQSLKVDVHNGEDPVAQKQAKRNAPEPKTFGDLVQSFKKYHFQTLKESTQKTYENRIDTELLPVFGGIQLDLITRGHIFELLQEIAFDREQPYQANRVQAILSSIFSYGMQSDVMEFNPVKGIKKLGEEEGRERYLIDNEIKTFWNALSDINEPWQSALRILLLLGQRKTETISMKWEQIDNGVFTITDNKSKRKHEVPLPPLAMDIIGKLENDSPYVFESTRHPGEHLKWLRASFKKATRGIDNIRIHDLRHTTGTWLSKLGFNRTVVGKTLNHKQQAGDNHVTARYDNYDYMKEKRQALNRWSNKLQKILAGDMEATIHQLG